WRHLTGTSRTTQRERCTGGVRVAPTKQSPDHLVDRLPKRVEIHRLGEMSVEAGLATAAKVVVLPEAGHRNAADVLRRLELSHHVRAAAVGQPDVRYEQVEMFPGGDRQRFGYRARSPHAASEVGQQLGHDAARVFVVFDQ